MPKQKISEVFEGENSSLRKTFEKAVEQEPMSTNKTIRELVEDAVEKIEELMPAVIVNLHKDGWATQQIKYKKYLHSTLLHSALLTQLQEIEDMVEGMNNFRQAKVDGKKDWNNALEQSARKVDALLSALKEKKDNLN